MSNKQFIDYASRVVMRSHACPSTVRTRALFLFLLMLTVMKYSVAGTIIDPCGGPQALLNLVNRPSMADSACVVPNKEFVLESGYQYINLRGGAHAQNLPEAQLRFGLPYANELFIFLPNYNWQSSPSLSGYSYSTVGVKHEVLTSSQSVTSIEGAIGLPTGGSVYGSNRYNAGVNGITYYTFNDSWSATVMLSVVALSMPESQGSTRWVSFNPYALLSYSLQDDIDIYGELFGETRISATEGVGLNIDLGLLYLITHFFEIDVSVGQSLIGNIGYSNYIGLGFSLLLH